ncbi:MAG: hypothetical protein ACRCWJ_15005 [Casimicrobium sp.]
MKNPNAKNCPITKAIEIVGLMPLSRAVGLTYKAVTRWRDQGHLPSSCWSGKKDYAKIIERATGGKVTEKQLLARRPPKSPAVDRSASREKN